MEAVEETSYIGDASGESKPPLVAIGMISKGAFRAAKEVKRRARIRKGTGEKMTYNGLHR
jgi:hypothetical protein